MLNLIIKLKEIFMSEEIVEPVVEVDENEPVYYNSKTLTLITSVARVFSWVVLVGFVLLIVGNYINLQELSQGAALTDIFKQASARIWIYTNMVTPLLTGLGLFIILQGISTGLDVLLEIDFNTRESAK
jgi:multisubunit Na+/H+ antiporter MnhB subunit